MTLYCSCLCTQCITAYSGKVLCVSYSLGMSMSLYKQKQFPNMGMLHNNTMLHAVSSFNYVTRLHRLVTGTDSNKGNIHVTKKTKGGHYMDTMILDHVEHIKSLHAYIVT